MSQTQIKNLHKEWDWVHFISMDDETNAKHKGAKGDLIPYTFDTKNISSYDWKAKNYSASEWETEKRCYFITKKIWTMAPSHHHTDLLDHFSNIEP